MTLVISLTINFRAKPTLLKAKVGQHQFEIALEAYALRPADAAEGDLSRARVLESKEPHLQNPELLPFEQVTVSKNSFELGPNPRSDTAHDAATVQTLATALTALLETRLDGSKTVSVRNLLLQLGHDDVQTDCLVVAEDVPERGAKRIESPSWLHYLLIDVGWRGKFRLFRANESNEIGVDSPFWSLAEHKSTQFLILATSSDIRDKSFENSVKVKIRNAIPSSADTPFVALEQSLLATRKVLSRRIPMSPGENLYCRMYRAPEPQTTEAGVFPPFTVVLWYWAKDAANPLPEEEWRLVGQVAPDEIAAVPKMASVLASLEVDEDARVWTRIESDRREPMAILVGDARHGVTALEVSNVSYPTELHIKADGKLDWFVERIVSDRLVVNRRPLRPTPRRHHDDVWGGKVLMPACRDLLLYGETLDGLYGEKLDASDREKDVLESKARYLQMIPSHATELRAFIESCLA